MSIPGTAVSLVVTINPYLFGKTMYLDSILSTFHIFQADFFWECNGETKGPHTGFIQNWIRNCKSKSIDGPKSIKRKRRNEINISQEEVDAIEELCATEPTPESHPRVMELLAATFMYRQTLRANNRMVSEITSEFPYLLNEDAVVYYLNFGFLFC